MSSSADSARFRCLASWVAAVTVFLACGPHALAQTDEPPPGEYRIVDGRVDVGTYTGWKIFHSACHVCHGENGIGTVRAPNLVESVQKMTPRTFAKKVLRSYGLIARASVPGEADSQEAQAQLDMVMSRERNQSSEVRMPAWGEDNQVRPHILDLFAYLTARANGLSQGEPKIFKTAQ